jgi:hypothetical protein
MKPFDFLQTVIANDIHNWRFACSHDSESTGSAATCDNSPEALFLSAFDSRSSESRGVAWSALAQLPNSPRLFQLTRNTLIARFSLDPAGVTDVVVKAWLNGLRMLVDQVERKVRIAQFQRDRFQRLAGDDLVAMESKHNSFLSFICHHNPQRRQAALIKLAVSTLPRSDITAQLEHCVQSDEDLEVRITATRCLIDLARSQEIPGVCQLLAKVVQNDANPKMLREIAYQGLFEVNHLPPASWPITRDCQGQFEFPRDVDWELVSNCAGTTS